MRTTVNAASGHSGDRCATVRDLSFAFVSVGLGQLLSQSVCAIANKRESQASKLTNVTSVFRQDLTLLEPQFHPGFDGNVVEEGSRTGLSADHIGNF